MNSIIVIHNGLPQWFQFEKVQKNGDNQKSKTCIIFIVTTIDLFPVVFTSLRIYFSYQ